MNVCSTRYIEGRVDILISWISLKQTKHPASNQALCRDFKKHAIRTSRRNSEERQNIPPVASSSIFSMDRGPRVVRMMSATACGQRSGYINYTLALQQSKDTGGQNSRPAVDSKLSDANQSALY